MITVSEEKERNLLDVLIAWIKLSRPLFFVSPGIIPFSLGSLLALHAIPVLNWPVFIIGNCGVIAILLITFHLNEYFDYYTDIHNRDYNRYSGGSRILPSGIVKREEVLKFVVMLIVLTFLLGLLLQFRYHTGKLTILLGGLGFFSGIFYTAPPIKGSYRGVGEILIGISCGWLTVFTGYYLQTGSLSLEISLLSLPLVFSITAVILINEFPDIQSDKLDNKGTLVIKLGDAGAARLYILLLILTYFSIIINTVILPKVYLFYNLSMLLSFPLSLRNILAVKARRYQDKKSLEKICGRTALINLSICVLPLMVFLLSRIWI